jgi:hypothetical protein
MLNGNQTELARKEALRQGSPHHPNKHIVSWIGDKVCWHGHGGTRAALSYSFGALPLCKLNGLWQ